MRSTRTLLGALCVALLAAGAASAQEVDWRDVGARWGSLSAEERESYRQLALRERARRPAPPQMTPADQCAGATLETGLPFLDVNNTSAATDDYFLAVPGCGTTFPGITGLTGGDIAYAFQVDVTCTLQVDATVGQPNEGGGGGFLAGYVVTDCGDTGNTCVGGDDDFPAGDGSIGFPFTAVPGTTYFLIMDATLSQVVDGYTLSVQDPQGQGCQLIPVELQSFSVE